MLEPTAVNNIFARYLRDKGDTIQSLFGGFRTTVTFAASFWPEPDVSGQLKLPPRTDGAETQALGLTLPPFFPDDLAQWQSV